MKIGIGLYRHMLTRDYYDFAPQAGCTHVVVHLVDYFDGGLSNPPNNQPTGSKYEPWGVAGGANQLWTVEELKTLGDRSGRNQIFPIMQKHLRSDGTFWVFSAGALLTIVLVAWLIPETKGRSLEDITKFCQRRKRRLGDKTPAALNEESWP
jgi:Sugar (and other) transporter